MASSGRTTLRGEMTDTETNKSSSDIRKIVRWTAVTVFLMLVVLNAGNAFVYALDQQKAVLAAGALITAPMTAVFYPFLASANALAWPFASMAGLQVCSILLMGSVVAFRIVTPRPKRLSRDGDI